MSDHRITINDITVLPGQRQTMNLPLGTLYTHTPLAMPIHVICGKKPGPRLFISAAIHGDELNGVEIIRRLLKSSSLKRMRGVLIAIPVVNVHGLLHHSRYLPDRRDLNRSFPGSNSGSLAARMAHIFMEQIVSQCNYGIDLHTAAIHRSNLPQIRANLDDKETARLASAFGVPVILNANLRDGSLRETSADSGTPILLYEGGEALRFDEFSIRAGVKGIRNVMRELAMLPPSKSKKTPIKSVIARSSSWARAQVSGMFRAVIPLGAHVTEETVLGVISDPFGENEWEVHASFEGIVIGRNSLPLVNEGDALFHIARFRKAERVAENIGDFQDGFQTEHIDSTDLDSPII